MAIQPVWGGQAPERANDFWLRPRTLKLRHQNGERLQATYWSDGEIIATAHQEISYFMRDRVVGRGVFMAPVLFDILYGVIGWLDYFNVKSEVILTSGYRDPRRNARIEGAALNSLHPQGRASDVAIPGVSSRQVSLFGQWLGGGGVGWYPHKGFIHLDDGRVRTWRG